MALTTRSRRLRPALAAWAMVLAVVSAVMLGPAPSAHALDTPLEFSSDGTTWTSAPPASLFDNGVVLVPGGSVSSTLHMRSTAQTPGVLVAALTNVRVSDESAEKHFGVRATSDAGTGADGAGVGLGRTAVTDLEEFTPIGPRLTLAPGQSAQFTLTVDLDLRPGGTGAQNSAIALDLALSFTEAAAVPGGDGLPGGQDGEGLNPPQLIPALPAPGGQHPSAGTDGAGTDGAGGAASGAAADPAESSETSADRGALAVTGIARGAIIVAGVLTALGALLVAISRRTRDRS